MFSIWINVAFLTASCVICECAAEGRTLVEVPANTMALFKSTITLYCQTSKDNGIRWNYISNASGESHLIYNGVKVSLAYSSRFSVMGATNGYLSIAAVTDSDAGTYVCSDSREKFSAELIVLNTHPICRTSFPTNQTAYLIEFDTVTMTCSVNYSGNWAPVMAWQQDGGAVITAGVVNNTVPYKSVTYSLTVAAIRNLTASKYTCTTYFTEANRPIKSDARTAPEYKYTWDSPRLKVLYSPTLVTITRTTFPDREELRCLSDGSPPPVYQWLDVSTGHTTQGFLVVVNKTKSSTTALTNVYSFQCIATNSLGRNVNGIVFSITAVESMSSEHSVAMYAAYAGGAATCLLLIIIVIIVCVRKKQTGDGIGGQGNQISEPNVVYSEVIRRESNYEDMDPATRDSIKPSVYTHLGRHNRHRNENISNEDYSNVASHISL